MVPCVAAQAALLWLSVQPRPALAYAHSPAEDMEGSVHLAERVWELCSHFSSKNLAAEPCKHLLCQAVPSPDVLSTRHSSA